MRKSVVQSKKYYFYFYLTFFTAPIDETLLEPNVPEASKTPQISVPSPLSLTSPSSEVNTHPIQGKSATSSSSQSFEVPPSSSQVSPRMLHAPPQSQHSSLEQPSLQTKLQVSPSSFIDHAPQIQLKHEAMQMVVSQVSPTASTSPNHSQPESTTPKSQVVQSVTPQAQSQVVLLVKKENGSQDGRLSRKRPRSASLDVPLNVQAPNSMMPPPVKKVSSTAFAVSLCL